MRISRYVVIVSATTLALLGVTTTTLFLRSQVVSASAKGENGSRHADVIVIGAGMAGLAAAKTLKDLDYDVIVVEARSRIGGRVWTDRSMGSVPLDLGASWIHGVTDNPITRLAKQFGVTTKPTDMDNHWVYDHERRLLADADSAAIDERFEQALNEARQIGEQRQRQGEGDISLQAALDQTATLKQAGPRAKTELTFATNTTIEHEFAGDASQLSALRFDEGASQRGGDVLFPGGYGQLTDRLAQGLDIRLGQKVTAVDHQANGVVVTTEKGAFQADYAVVTLPLGVLKKGSVSFNPPLPATKLAAIQKLGMGTLNKLYLRFPTVFWPKEADWLGFLGPRKGEWAEYVNMYKVTGQPILLCFNAATYGRQVEGLTNEQQTSAAMATLRTMFGHGIPEPTAMLASRWASDPFAFGSYSYLAVGCTSKDREALAQPVGKRLFFAGEATSVSAPAMVHGAYLSGLAAAKQLDALAED